jgi:Fic family protein
MATIIKYLTPRNWIHYNLSDRTLLFRLTEAKAAVLSLTQIPYQRSWVEALQAVQLKSEVAGTSRIEGADFTDRELDLALQESPEQLLTRSQRQAHAAMKAYRWIASLKEDQPVNCDLFRQVHTTIIGDADSDHCPPGVLRPRDVNVTFGIPEHRGCNGGEECASAFKNLGEAVQLEFKSHDRLIQALALHYHFAAMHPFLDGNGRTARAVEALMLRRSGLTDHLFIAMSNYYYDEKLHYLAALSAVRAPDYDLTPFLIFGLKGIKNQCERLFREIRINVSKSIFRNTMYDLFGRLQTSRKAVIAKRHTAILNLLLRTDQMALEDVLKSTEHFYKPLKAARKAVFRDLNHLLDLGALRLKREGEGVEKIIYLFVNLDWPAHITENGFMEKVKKFPKAKSYAFLSS